jgi:S1-C subfamily serine protease
VNHCEFTARKTAPLVLSGDYDCTGNFHAAGNFSVTRCTSVSALPPAAGAASASSNNTQPSLNAAVVRIRSEKTLGSGFFVTEDLVATNSHVVHGSRQVWMSLSSGDEHLGTVAYENSDLDFALVRSSVRGTPLPLRNSPLSDGEGVIAVGFPQGRRIAALSTGTVHKIVECCVEHDAMIAGGSSGGPLVDQNMQVIGINAILSKRKGDRKNETDRAWALKMGYIAESLRELDAPSPTGSEPV